MPTFHSNVAINGANVFVNPASSAMINMPWATYQSADADSGEGVELLLGQRKVAEDGTVMFRVRATRARRNGTIPEGTLGGWMVVLDNLSDNGWIDAESEIRSPDVRVFDDALVERSVLSGQTTVSGTSTVADSEVSNSNIHGNSTLSRCLVADGALIQDSTVLSSTVKSGSKVLAESTVSLSEISRRSEVHGSRVAGSRVTKTSKVLNGARVVDSTLLNRGSANGSGVVVIENSTVENHSGVFGDARVQDSAVMSHSIVMNSAEVTSSEITNGSMVIEYARAVTTTLDKVTLKGSAAVRGGALDNTTMG